MYESTPAIVVEEVKPAALPVRASVTLFVVPVRGASVTLFVVPVPRSSVTTVFRASFLNVEVATTTVAFVPSTGLCFLAPPSRNSSLNLSLGTGSAFSPSR